MVLVIRPIHVRCTSKSLLHLGRFIGRGSTLFPSTNRRLISSIDTTIQQLLRMDRASVQTPKSWPELKDLLEKGHIDILGRDEKQSTTYVEAMKKVKEEWVSLEDYIFNKVWGFEYIIDEQGKKKLKNPVDFTKSNIVFRKNDFPYCLQPDIGHYVIWDVLPLKEQDVRQTIETNRPGLEYLCFMNPPNLRSIRNVHHWHAFVREALETKDNSQASS